MITKKHTASAALAIGALAMSVLDLAQAAPTLQFPANVFGVAETTGSVSLPVWRLNDATAAVSVDYATFDGSARAGTNYAATNGTLAFAAGETNRLIVVPILDDGVADGTLYFRVALSNPTGGAVLGAPTNASVFITESYRRVQFELSYYSIQESDGAVSMKVLRGDDTPLPAFTVDYAPVDGTASNGVNYVATNSTLTFAEAQTVQTITVPILYHEGQDADRQFKLILRNPTGGVALGTNTTATITILDTTEMKPHRFDAIAALPDGSVQLTLGGGVSQRFHDYYDLYPIEVSSNLVDWMPLVTLQRTNAVTNALTYTDTATANWPVRFYRTPTNHLITPFSVKPSGPYPVGVLSRKLTDPSRPSRYRAYDDGSFMVSVWYPAAPSAGRLPGPLLDPQIA